MATDGVKIIDSDTAHDVYWGIMDLYDDGASIETIKKEFPFPQSKDEYYDDFDEEIYSTAFALAIWEIGGMTEDILKEVKAIIDKGACVKVWSEEYSLKEGKARQKELDKLLGKISSVNQEIRKRKKYKKVTNFIFYVDDVLTFQLKDKKNYVTILLNIQQYRGSCTYEFSKILFVDDKVPELENIMNSEIIGRKIPSGHGMDMDKILSIGMEEMIKQGGIEEILKREAEKTGSFVIGIDKIGIEHKDLINFKDKFQKIGTIRIKKDYKDTGSFGYASTFDDFSRDFPDLNKYIKSFKR
jgi:hypothetical protein